MGRGASEIGEYESGDIWDNRKAERVGVREAIWSAILQAEEEMNGRIPSGPPPSSISVRGKLWLVAPNEEEGWVTCGTCGVAGFEHNATTASPIALKEPGIAGLQWASQSNHWTAMRCRGNGFPDFGPMWGLRNARPIAERRMLRKSGIDNGQTDGPRNVRWNQVGC